MTEGELDAQKTLLKATVQIRVTGTETAAPRCPPSTDQRVAPLIGGGGHRWDDELAPILAWALAGGCWMTSAGLAGLAHPACSEFPEHCGA